MSWCTMCKTEAYLSLQFYIILDVGQIEGAFMQALGYVTIEQMLRSKHTGELLSVGPGNYKVHNIHCITS